MIAAVLLARKRAAFCWLQMNIRTSSKVGKIPMVRVRNPWGNECEWKGAWSDK